MRNTIRSVAAAALIGTAATGASAQQGQAVQWRVEDGGNGHWYQGMLMADPQSLGSAQAYALPRGGHIVTVTSRAESSFLMGMPGVSSLWMNYWVGPLIGIQLDGDACASGCWITGEPLDYSNWWPGNPDAPATDCCVYLFAQTDRWQNHPCGAEGWGVYPRSFIVEWSADCNHDGIVDYGQCRDGSLPDYNGNNIPDCCEAGTPCVVGSYPIQWRVEDGGNGHWYLANRWESPKTWEDARSSAEQMGGYLACVTSAAENQFIYSSSNLYQPGCANGQEGWHLGGFQDLSAPDYSEPAGGWRWISGEPWNYTAWLTGESGGDRPNNFGVGGEQYLKMSEMPYAPRWDDVGVGSSQLLMCGAIIEWSDDCNDDGIVDYGQILTGQLTDSDADGVPNICQCPGDITGNGAVDGVDLAIVLGAWGTSGQGEFQADIDRDGVVSGTDLAYVLGGWGPCQ